MEKKIPLVFLHGLGADHRQVEAMIVYDRLITFDLPAHGEIPLPLEQVSFNLMAHYVESQLAELHIDEYVIGGISMGAAVALRVALDQPDRCRGLLEVRPAWDCIGMPESNQISASLSQDFRNLGFASATVVATGQLQLTTPANRTPPPGSGGVAAAIVIGLILVGAEIITRSQSNDQKNAASDEIITTNDTDKKTPVSAIDEYLEGTMQGRVSDKTEQRERSGGLIQAEEDFRKLVDPNSILTHAFVP